MATAPQPDDDDLLPGGVRSGSRIDLGEASGAFHVHYWDYVTVTAGEWTNGGRLDLCVRATAGAVMGAVTPAASFPGRTYSPDEATWSSGCRLPVTVANAIALLATEFPWTRAAAAARDGFAVPRAAVARVRDEAARAHAARAAWLAGLIHGSEPDRSGEPPAATVPTPVEWWAGVK